MKHMSEIELNSSKSSYSLPILVLQVDPPTSWLNSLRRPDPNLSSPMEQRRGSLVLGGLRADNFPSPQVD